LASRQHNDTGVLLDERAVASTARHGRACPCHTFLNGRDFLGFRDGGTVDVSPIVRQMSPPCNRDKGPTLARQVWRRSRRAERISYGRSRPCSAPATWKWNFGAAAAVLVLPLLRATHATRLWSGGDLGHQLLELHTAGFNRLLVGEIADRPTAFEHPDIAPISISSYCCI
jgi:hypothetical protein